MLAALFGLVGCVELDLGSTPFFCNNGTPPCPYGYTCVTSGNKRICVKEGLPPPKLDGMASAGDMDTGTVPDSGTNIDGKVRVKRPSVSLRLMKVSVFPLGKVTSVSIQSAAGLPPRVRIPEKGTLVLGG